TSPLIVSMPCRDSSLQARRLGSPPFLSAQGSCLILAAACVSLVCIPLLSGSHITRLGSPPFRSTQGSCLILAAACVSLVCIPLLSGSHITRLGSPPFRSAQGSCTPLPVACVAPKTPTPNMTLQATIPMILEKDTIAASSV